MLPNPIPQEPGLLSVLVRPGKWHTSTGGGSITFAGKSLPFLGSVGTNFPAVWRHVIWWDGKAYEAKLKCDLPGYNGSYEILREHFERHPHVWSPVMPVGSQL